MKSIKVRFNLGRGKNYMKWKVQYTDGTIEYHSPTDVQLVMHECILKNHRKTAQKIYDGGEKVVCAWVLCKRLAIVKSDRFTKADLNGERVRYNPRVTPHWMLDGENVDGISVDKLVSVDFGLYKM
jgi:hypothetical protein